MSYQVGAACFATVVEAGGAACAAYAPVSTLVENGAVVRTVSCTSADQTTGALRLQITSTAVDGSPGTSTIVSQLISYPDCREGDYVAAAEILVGATLACWATVWGLNAIRNFLDWSRGEA